MSRGLTIGLVALNLLLAGLLGWLWIDSQGRLRNVHWQPPAAIRPDLGSLSATSIPREDADISRFMAILERPLFSPARRPPPPAPPPKLVAPVPADPFDTVHLYGFFTGKDGGGVITRVDGKTRRVKLAESIGEWKLTEIRSREVVFTRGGASRVLPLVQARQGTATGPARPAFSAPVLSPAAPVPTPAAPVSPQNVSPAAGAQQQEAGAAKSGAAAKPSSPFTIGGSQ